MMGRIQKKLYLSAKVGSVPPPSGRRREGPADVVIVGDRVHEGDSCVQSLEQAR